MLMDQPVYEIPVIGHSESIVNLMPTFSQVDSELMLEVVRQGASDLHITSDAPPMLRIDGSLQPAGDVVAWSSKKVTSALLSILSDAQRAAFERESELDFAYPISNSARFRVNFYQQRGSIGGAFRIIPTELKGL